MNRALYPSKWAEIAVALKNASGWRCQGCGVQCRRPGEPLVTHRLTLTVAHLDHNPGNCEPENLRALCAPCHLRYDAGHHAETRRARRDGGQADVD